MKYCISLQAVLCCSLAAAVVYGDHHVELKTVKAGPIELKVPQEWKSTQPRTRMRAAQMAIPGKDGNAAELVVFDFGGPSGGVRANVNRWIGQFQPDGRKVEMLQGKCAVGSYVWVDLAGVWKKPDGPPFAQRTVDTPNSRVTNILLVDESGGSKDYYFLKLSGPDAFVKSQAKALKVALGVDMEKEKPFSLEE